MVSEEIEFALRELDPTERRIVGLEYWRASRTLPRELLAMLPAPSLGVAAEPIRAAGPARRRVRAAACVG